MVIGKIGRTGMIAAKRGSVGSSGVKRTSVFGRSQLLLLVMMLLSPTALCERSGSGVIKMSFEREESWNTAEKCPQVELSLDMNLDGDTDALGCYDSNAGLGSLGRKNLLSLTPEQLTIISAELVKSLNVPLLQTALAIFTLAGIAIGFFCLCLVASSSLIRHGYKSKSMKKILRPTFGFAKQWASDLSDVFVFFPCKGFHFILRCGIMVPLRAVLGYGFSIHTARKTRLQQKLMQEAERLQEERPKPKASKQHERGNTNCQTSANAALASKKTKPKPAVVGEKKKEFENLDTRVVSKVIAAHVSGASSQASSPNADSQKKAHSDERVPEAAPIAEATSSSSSFGDRVCSSAERQAAKVNDAGQRQSSAELRAEETSNSCVGKSAGSEKSHNASGVISESPPRSASATEATTQDDTVTSKVRMSPPNKTESREIKKSPQSPIHEDVASEEKKPTPVPAKAASIPVRAQQPVEASAKKADDSAQQQSSVTAKPTVRKTVAAEPKDVVKKATASTAKASSAPSGAASVSSTAPSKASLPSRNPVDTSASPPETVPQATSKAPAAAVAPAVTPAVAPRNTGEVATPSGEVQSQGKKIEPASSVPPSPPPPPPVRTRALKEPVVSPPPAPSVATPKQPAVAPPPPPVHTGNTKESAAILEQSSKSAAASKSAPPPFPPPGLNSEPPPNVKAPPSKPEALSDAKKQEERGNKMRKLPHNLGPPPPGPAPAPPVPAPPPPSVADAEEDKSAAFSQGATSTKSQSPSASGAISPDMQSPECGTIGLDDPQPPPRGPPPTRLHKSSKMEQQPKRSVGTSVDCGEELGALGELSDNGELSGGTGGTVDFGSTSGKVIEMMAQQAQINQTTKMRARNSRHSSAKGVIGTSAGTTLQQEFSDSAGVECSPVDAQLPSPGRKHEEDGHLSQRLEDMVEELAGVNSFHCNLLDDAVSKIDAARDALKKVAIEKEKIAIDSIANDSGLRVSAPVFVPGQRWTGSQISSFVD